MKVIKKIVFYLNDRAMKAWEAELSLVFVENPLIRLFQILDVGEIRSMILGNQLFFDDSETASALQPWTKKN
jgi:hypothetical protein